MRRFLLAAALSVAAAGGAISQETPDSAIQGVIQGQIDAFRADDFARAFTFASPAIKRIFQDPDRFGMMVREGYPMVWRPSAVEFGELREVAGALWQRVIVTDAEGRVHVLDYQMVPAGEGWQINGVQLLRAPDVGA
jgi:hypothetical protein